MTGKKKRRSEEQHSGSHGAWKVAYADFVTAMMAFFLLMWLLNMTSDEQKARVSYYFRYFSIFDKSSSSMLDISKNNELSVAVMEGDRKEKAKSEGDQKQANDMPSHSKENNQIENLLTAEQQKEQLQSHLKKIIESDLADVKSQVIVDGLKNCVRIQMTDEQGSVMFPTGSTVLTPRAREIITVLTNSIKGFSGPIAIEGNTDARPYPSQEYTNWELSLGRASAARKEMVACGLDINRIVRISGFADKRLLNKEDPSDPRNRRISILLYKEPQKFLPVIAPVTQQDLINTDELSEHKKSP